MGYGGYLTLLNGSPYEWVLTGQHSYQMDTWKWPTIPAGKASKVFVEFATLGHTRDDAGEAYYSIKGTPNTFQVVARKPSEYKLTIDLDGLSTRTSPRGSKVELGFRHNAAVNWILSQDDAGEWWSNSGMQIDWMQQSMPLLGNRTLRHITMPGSHDAGMGTFTGGTIGAHLANTQTQYLDFYGQLMAGSRYFDLRPVISNGKWVSGHYAEVGEIWLGGNGQPIAEIIQQINKFTAQYKELIIINLSHCYDTDNNWADLTQAQWNALFETLKGINHRHIVPNPAFTDFTQKRLGDFITDRASVFIVAQLPTDIYIGNYLNQGFYEPHHFPLYDSYSNTNKALTMRTDQLAKLHQHRNITASPALRKDLFHIFSWTLTQQPGDVLNYDRAIMNLATSVFDDLILAFNEFTPETFPNVLYVDAVGVRDKVVVFPYDKVRKVPTNMDIVALVMAVNNAIAGRNPVVTGG